MIPSIPSLPTDNLYKFIAIGGVVLFMFGAVLQQVETESAFDLTTEMDTASARYFGKADAFYRETIELSKLDPKWVHGKEYYDLKREVAVDSAREASLHRQEIWRRKLHDSNVDFYGTLQVVGGLLALLGFIMWYAMVQRHQDKILKREATDTEPVPRPPFE